MISAGSNRKQLFFKAVIVFVGRIDAHKNGVEWKAAYAFDERFWTEAASHAKMANRFLIASLHQGFDGATFGKYLVNVFLNSNIVQLPGVNVVGIKQLERDFEVFKRGIAGSLFSFGGDKNLITVFLKPLT